MPVTFLEGEVISVSQAITEVITIFGQIVDIVQSNIIFMIPIGVGLLGAGIGLFSRLRHS